MFAAAVDLTHIAQILRRERRVIALRREVHHLTEASDESQRSAQFMADVGHELLLQAAHLVSNIASLGQVVVHAANTIGRLVQSLQGALQLRLAIAGQLHPLPGLGLTAQSPGERSVQVSSREPGDKSGQKNHDDGADHLC